MGEVFFVDLKGDEIQYKGINSHIGLASKIISENENLKKLFNESEYKRADLFLINKLGFMSVSIDPIFGTHIVANNELISDTQRKILMNYKIEGAKVDFLENDVKQDQFSGRHI